MIEDRDLQNRQQPGRRRSDAPGADDGLTLEILQTRLAALRKVKPNLKEIHCGHCWGEGRDAAIRAIAGPRLVEP